MKKKLGKFGYVILGAVIVSSNSSFVSNAFAENDNIETAIEIQADEVQEIETPVEIEEVEEVQEVEDISNDTQEEQQVVANEEDKEDKEAEQTVAENDIITETPDEVNQDNNKDNGLSEEEKAIFEDDDLSIDDTAVEVIEEVSNTPEVISTFSGTTRAVTSSKSWNISNSNFRNLGTISSNITVDGLGLVANSSKTMTVNQSNVTVGSNTFNYALNLGGSGATGYRAISIPVSGNSTIKVTCMSSGSSARTLNIADSNGKVLGTITAGTSAEVGSINIDYDGTVYIYSAGSGINVYKVQLDTTGSVPSGSSSSNSATTTTTEATTQATTTATNSTKSWNISNSNFRSLGTISSNTTVDGLSLVANGTKTMSVSQSDVTVGSNTFNYALNLGGSGSTSYRAISMPISGTSTIKVTCASSGSSARTLNVTDSNGNVLGTITAETTAEVGSVKLNYTGTVYIYSAGSGINIYKVQLDTTGSVPNGSTGVITPTTTTTEATTQATTTAVGNSVTVSNFNDLTSAVKTMASKSGGGTVYVNAKKIDCTGQLALNSTKGNPVSIIGVQQSDGTYPSLNFESFRASTIGSTGNSLKASGDSSVGVRISGSNYTLKNLIIEKAGDNGIQIKGSGANYNTVENCIVRYNNDAGVQITDGASYNTMRFIYSYRNCDVYTRGGNADGFAPKLGATTGNTFYGCYAWDNSDDGWDSFDKTDSGYTKDLSYEWCACWNNGNPDVFTGKYDYDNGKSLDTNLFLVQLISAQDSSFVSNYKNKKFSLPTASFIKTDVGTINISDWLGSKYDGNPNGFKFGSINSKSDLKRTIKNCVSFDHASKGFDNNNSSCTASFSNCISFDNGYNYYFQPFTIKGWSNINGFNGSSKDKLPSGYSVSTPSSSTQASIRSKVDSTVNTIVNDCNNNVIPGEVYFNIF